MRGAAGRVEAILRVLAEHRRGRMGTGVGWVQREHVRRCVEQERPIEFTLPAFPCKSPNPAKVAGTLPDEGERLALASLQGLCARVAAVHPPGAGLVICSDGHVFTDVIGVEDATVDRYHDALVGLIADEGHDRLSTFDLRRVWGADDCAAKRSRLDVEWAESPDALRAAARTDPAVARVLCGMTRFLLEDAVDLPDASGRARQRVAKARAYRVLARSRAWGALVAAWWPDALRLSIHPQPVGADKFPIALVEGTGEHAAWMTPWHAVTLHTPDGPRLVRHDAVPAGARVERRDDRVWCYHLG